jgi:hypothetical protein
MRLDISKEWWITFSERLSEMRHKNSDSMGVENFKKYRRIKET